MVPRESRTPVWLWALGVVAVGAIAGAMLYAVWIGLLNFDRIGV